MAKELKVVCKENKGKKEDWFYSDIVRNHFFKPKNFLKRKDEVKSYDGYGVTGDLKCGDRMDMWIKVDRKKDKIIGCKWQTFGCAGAIASTSMLSEMITEKGGMKINDALNIKPIDIIKRLGGLPKIKYHCSVLGDRALRAAINDYFKKSGQEKRI